MPEWLGDLTNYFTRATSDSENNEGNLLLARPIVNRWGPIIVGGSFAWIGDYIKRFALSHLSMDGRALNNTITTLTFNLLVRAHDLVQAGGENAEPWLAYVLTTSSDEDTK